VAHYLFNHEHGDPAAELLGVGMWGVAEGEPHRDALAPGDLVLVYLAAPNRVFVGRAELATAVHDWTPAEAHSYPGDAPAGVLLTQVEEWEPPVPMEAVLARMDPSDKARADFDVGVVRITESEYATALAVAGR
jgi:hypothetical protein